jgi:hypothetical protein
MNLVGSSRISGRMSTKSSPDIAIPRSVPGSASPPHRAHLAMATSTTPMFSRSLGFDRCSSDLRVLLGYRPVRVWDPPRIDRFCCLQPRSSSAGHPQIYEKMSSGGLATIRLESERLILLHLLWITWLCRISSSSEQLGKRAIQYSLWITKRAALIVIVVWVAKLQIEPSLVLPFR